MFLTWIFMATQCGFTSTLWNIISITALPVYEVSVNAAAAAARRGLIVAESRPCGRGHVWLTATSRESFMDSPLSLSLPPSPSLSPLSLPLSLPSLPSSLSLSLSPSLPLSFSSLSPSLPLSLSPLPPSLSLLPLSLSLSLYLSLSLSPFLPLPLSLFSSLLYLSPPSLSLLPPPSLPIPPSPSLPLSRNVETGVSPLPLSQSADARLHSAAHRSE